MSFLNPDKEQSSVMKIHNRTYSWSGGEKAVDPNNPLAGKKAFAEIRFFEGSGQSLVKGRLPEPKMKMAVIGQTFSVSGFDSKGTAETNVSYFSNETVAWGQKLRVCKRDARGTEIVAEGDYKTVKDELGKLIKCQHNVYFYDFERKCIDRFTFVGASYGAWTDFKKAANKEVYTGFTIVEPGKAESYPTGVSILPQFSKLTNYTEAEIAEIAEHAKKMDEYEAYLEENAKKSVDSFDQTPQVYDGEQSQELPDASTAPAYQPQENVIDLGDIPF